MEATEPNKELGTKTSTGRLESHWNGFFSTKSVPVNQSEFQVMQTVTRQLTSTFQINLTIDQR